MENGDLGIDAGMDLEAETVDVSATVIRPGKEGMVHISKIAKERIDRVEDVLTLGDQVTVVCLGKDKMGRMSFSMKDVAQV